MSCQCHRASERGRVGFNTSVSRCNTPPLSNLRKSLLLVAIRYKSILLSFVSAKKFFMGYHKELSLCTPSPSISRSLYLSLSLSLYLSRSLSHSRQPSKSQQLEWLSPENGQSQVRIPDPARPNRSTAVSISFSFRSVRFFELPT